MYEDLRGKVAIITGARRGMGKSHSSLLADFGVKVVVSDISQEDCEKVVHEIKSRGGEAFALKCDVSLKEEVDHLVKKTIEKWGKIDILINNAGIVQFVPFLEMTENDWDKMIAINLKGYFLCSQAVTREMVKQKSGGVIINIASVAMGQQGIGLPNIVHYCASKGGIIAMTEALAVELAPYRIRVNAIAPGMIDTPMIDSVKQDSMTLEAFLKRVPLGRVGKPEEISQAVLFLASESSSYITGSTLIIDGGWLAG